MNIAIPKQNNTIATCFDAAAYFEIIVVEENRVKSTKTVQCHGQEGYQRVRLMRLYEIQTLICNGIKNFYRDQLVSLGIEVISNINDSISSTLKQYLSNQLVADDTKQRRIENNDLIKHDELVLWSTKLFKQNGYSISGCPEGNAFLIDFIASINCPVCSREVKVAICCGAQIYWTDKEIREFNHIAGNRFNARVYVNLANSRIEQCCHEYGINFLSPEMPVVDTDAGPSMIPILQKPVEGHEKAFKFTT